MSPRRKPIHRGRIYEVLIPQGISGFNAPPVRGIANGTRLQSSRRSALPDYQIIGDQRTIEADLWRWDDGHLPDYQPTGTREEAERYLLANPYAYACPKSSTPCLPIASAVHCRVNVN